MSNSTLTIKDANSTTQSLVVDLTGGNITPIHLEDATQRTALITALTAIVTAVSATVVPTQAVSASALPLPSGAATDAKLEAVRALLASALPAIGTDSAGIATQLAGVNVASTTPLTAVSDGTTNPTTGIGPVARVRGDFNLSVVCSSDFNGQYIIERRFTVAGGTGWHPLTALGTIITLTNSASEVLSEPSSGVDYRIRVTSLTAGSITSHRYNQ